MNLLLDSRQNSWRRTTAIVAILVVTICSQPIASAAPPTPSASPVSPADSLKYFDLDPQLKIELVAHEPEVVDPIAIRFDELGRMWVVEMRDYPLGPSDGQPPLSRIKILTDENGDGFFEKATLFVEHLPFITGIQPWRGGAFVTLAGKVAYMKDTNGDGRADLQETWYTGFAEENSQLRANHPRLGVDGWIYVANGLRGGSVVDARRPDAQPISISGRDFRFHPFTGEYEAISGAGQFGMTFDDGGHRFVCTNRNPCNHVVLEDYFLKRNSVYAIPAVIQEVAASGEKSHVFPLTRAWTTSNLHAGQFTAACGVKIYRGDALPEEFYGNIFTCEPTGNLIHREVLRPDGASFKSIAPYQIEKDGVVSGREFLASTDEWFRPVNTESGPDGAFYVVDMYRAVIEHPQFVPDELKKRPDQRFGDDRGRIYRIIPREGWTKPKPQTLSANEPEKLVEHLGDKNLWSRETAARLLYERQSAADSALLHLGLKNSEARIRLNSLWLLSQHAPLSDERLILALEDSSPEIREAAMMIVSRQSLSLPLRSRVTKIATSDTARLRFLAALVLSPAERTETEILAKAIFANPDDLWTRRAILISGANFPEELLSQLLKEKSFVAHAAKSPTAATITTELANFVIAKKQDDALSAILKQIVALPADAESLQMSCLTAVALGLAKQGSSLQKKLEASDHQMLRESVMTVLKRERSLASDSTVPEKRRSESLDLLVFDSESHSLFVTLANQEPSQVVRQRAITGLSRIGKLEDWKFLLAGFPKESPGMRRVILDGLFAEKQRTQALLDAIVAGTVKASELDRLQTDRLLKHSDTKIRDSAKTILAAAIPEDRVKVLAAYQGIFQLPDDPRRGRAVFEKNCAQCHRVGDLGHQVAPDISDSRTKSAQQILADILQPNRAIDNNYINYVVVTTDGRSLTGILGAETAGSITLRQPENKTVSLLRSEIEELRSTGLSLMPEGLEKNIPPQDMADVVSFIKNWRYLDGKTPFERNKASEK